MHHCSKFGEIQSRYCANKAKKCTVQNVGHDFDLKLWPFEPKIWSVHPCPRMHQCWKSGEIQSSKFQDIVLTRTKSAFSSIWPFDPKTWSIHPCPKMHYCSKSGENYVPYFWRYCVNNVRDAWTDAHFIITYLCNKVQYKIYEDKTLQCNRTERQRTYNCPLKILKTLPRTTRKHVSICTSVAEA